jgi:Uma2 family endonuclease
MSTDRTILQLGKLDDGRILSSEEFAEAEFDEPWRYEREDGRLIVMAPSGGGQIRATNPWRDRLIFYSYDHPELIEVITTEAWIRVNDGTDRIGDLGVYFLKSDPLPDIPDRIPDMMFEIVSPDRVSRDRDYVRKRAEYHALGVREYVIVDRFQKTVAVLTHTPIGYDELILTIGDVYESPLLPGFSVPLSDVF